VTIVQHPLGQPRRRPPSAFLDVLTATGVPDAMVSAAQAEQYLHRHIPMLDDDALELAIERTHLRWLVAHDAEVRTWLREQKQRLRGEQGRRQGTSRGRP
jgi:hypothetical protein